jgi:hypothetical protein
MKTEKLNSFLPQIKTREEDENKKLFCDDTFDIKKTQTIPESLTMLSWLQRYT